MSVTLPPAVRAAVEAALSRLSGAGGDTDLPETGTDITQIAAVGGGCISPTARIETPAGPFFLKWSGPDLPAGLLAAEAWGLRLLGDADEVRVPEVVAASDGEPGWLLLEWLESGGATPAAWERLGTELAALHAHQGDAFGADTDNFIGSLHQDNDPADSWPEFWITRRLEPQLRTAVDGGLLDDADRRRFRDLFTRLDDLLAPGNDDGPSLLHGDLWSGNVHMTPDGTAALIDPSVYYGHREVDLAMADLFGGFGRGFHAAYDDVWPLHPGYAPTRRAVYQLYYLLVHVNLFGAGYVGRTRSALGTAGF